MTCLCARRVRLAEGLTSRLAGGLLLASGLVAAPARAQLLDQFLTPDIGGRGIEPGVTVLSRDRPDYASGGVRAGSFVIRPAVTESLGYESNVLGTSNARGSSLVKSRADLEAASDVSRVNVRVALQVDDTRYLDLPKQSFTNWSARLSGSYELGQDIVSAGYEHLNLNQTARDLNVPQSLNQPLSYQIDTVRAEYRKTFNRVFVTPGIAVSNYSYGSGSAANSTFQQNFRDRVVYLPSVTLGYELSPRRNVVVILRDAVASYRTRPTGLPARDYNDFAALTGIDFDVTGLVRIRALVGYEIRTFDAATFKTIQAPVAELSTIWTPTGLTTVTAGVSRRIQDSADETTAGFTETSAKVRVDHEFRRNILLNGTAGVFYNEYNGGGAQTLYAAGAGASYLLNRNAAVTASYDFAARQSSNNQVFTTTTRNQVFGSSFTDHRILLGVRLAL